MIYGIHWYLVNIYHVNYIMNCSPIMHITIVYGQLAPYIHTVAQVNLQTKP